LANYADKASTALLLRGIRAFSSAINEMRSSVDSQLFLEMAYLECAVMDEAAEASGQTDSPVGKSEVRRQTTDDRRQKSEVRGQTHRPVEKSEPGDQKLETREQGPEARRAERERSEPESISQVVSRLPRQASSPPSNPTPASIDTLRAQWKQLITDVNNTNKATAAVLRNCHPYSVEGDVVRIKADHEFASKRLADPKHKEILTGALNHLLNGKFVVHIFVGQPDQESDLDDDPLVKAAKKLGGQVRE
jgi:DNA polymerase III subunit gamma/tau